MASRCETSALIYPGKSCPSRLYEVKVTRVACVCKANNDRYSLKHLYCITQLPNDSLVGALTNSGRGGEGRGGEGREGQEKGRRMIELKAL